MYNNNVNASSKSDKAIKVFKATKNIVVDGNDNEWSRAPKHKLRLEVDAGTGSPIQNKADLASEFSMLWDDENLYIFATIEDEEINLNGGELFEKDGFEVYIDGDNSKNVAPAPFPLAFPPLAYDTNDDFFRFIPGERVALSAWSIIDATNFRFIYAPTKKGYNIEIKIPFVDLPDFNGVDGHIFGVEFQNNDNDQDQRQNFLKWNSGLDDSYFNPSLFGTAILVD